MLCERTKKLRYGNRLAAETALGIARNQWRMRPQRAAAPPRRIYRCEACGDWHLTHKEKETVAA